MEKYAIIVAGGSGSRMRSEVPKQFLSLKGIPVLVHTLQAFQSAGEISVILVLPESQIHVWMDIVARENFTFPHRIIAGGPTRFHSVKNGLAAIQNENALIAVHDGVRPLITPATIRRCFEEAIEFGSAITSVPLKDSIRRTDYDGSSFQIDREKFRLVQTPQVFRADWMRKAFENDYQFYFTDCASVLEYAGFKVHLTEGDYQNIKITTPEDLIVAEALLQSTI